MGRVLRCSKARAVKARRQECAALRRAGYSFAASGAGAGAKAALDAEFAARAAHLVERMRPRWSDRSDGEFHSPPGAGSRQRLTNNMQFFGGRSEARPAQNFFC